MAKPKQTIKEIIKEDLENFKATSLAKLMTKEEITGYVTSMIYSHNKQIDRDGMLAKDVFEIVKDFNK